MVDSQILSFLNSDDSTLRLIGLEMLKKIENKSEYFDVLLSLLADENPDVRSYAVEILGEIKEKDPIPHILQLLSDSNVQVKLSILLTLEKRPSEQYLEHIVPLIKDSEIKVRRALIRVLAAINSPQILDTILKMVEDHSEVVVTEAINVLSNFKECIPYDFVKRYLNHPNKLVRRVVIEYLIAKVERDPITLWLSSLNDPEDEIKALVLSQIRLYVSEHQVELVKLQKTLTNNIIPMLSNASKRVRIEAIKLLRALKDPTAVEHLIVVANTDPNQDVSSLATEVIVAIRRANR